MGLVGIRGSDFVQTSAVEIHSCIVQLHLFWRCLSICSGPGSIFHRDQKDEKGRHSSSLDAVQL